MAPKMIEGSTWSAMSDMFALGIILWEILTGEVPYVSEGLEWYRKHVVKDNERPDVTKLPGEYIMLAHSLWHKDPAERPTANQFVAQILSRLLD